MIARQVHLGVIINVPSHKIQLNILWNIDQHWSGSSGTSNVERFFDDARNVFCFRDQIVMLGDGTTDLDHRRLLKGVAANKSRGDLSGNRDHRNAVHLRVSNRRDEIRRTWTTCPHTDANAVGRPRHPLRSECPPLFMSWKDRPNICTSVRQ